MAVFSSSEFLVPFGELLPDWAVIACDQFTSQPDYWKAVREQAGEHPSACRITFPEAELGLDEEARIASINKTMRRYLDANLFRRFPDSCIYVERTLLDGSVRRGVVGVIDLEAYDYAADAVSPVRATERTVVERIPPRVRIREGACLELSHVMLLMDDPGGTVLDSLTARKSELEPVYDFELMQGGGHLRGWAVEGADVKRVCAAVDALSAKAEGLLYAVGDGNHSLAAAKQCWLDLQGTLSPAERENHPARYALVELVNLACPALAFEPIHRLLTGVNPAALIADYRAFLDANGANEGPGDDLIAFDMTREWRFRSTPHPLRLLQGFLDAYLADHPGARIDYIHGGDALRKLISRPDAMGFMPRALGKSELFGYIRRWGVLPRKTFSMGGANEKRYYLEARKIMP